MEYKLTDKELLLLSSSLKFKSLYGYRNESAQNVVNINKSDINELKKSLEVKGYLKIHTDYELELEDNLFNALMLWSNPQYILTVFKEVNSELEPNEFVFLADKKAVRILNSDKMYILNYLCDESKIDKALISIFKLLPVHIEEGAFNISVEGKTFDNLLSSYYNNDHKKLEKQLNKLGIQNEEGYKLLESINNNKICIFAALENTTQNKGVLIKVAINGNAQYLFKHISYKGKDKVVLCKQSASQIIDSMFIF